MRQVSLKMSPAKKNNDESDTPQGVPLFAPLFHIISSICVPQKCKSDNYFATLFCNIFLQV